ILFLVLLMIGFYIVLNFFDESQKTILFYIRRFIIQPIFILLFIPAFYFQKKSE
ncbi:exosortase F system-associated protein, partial [Flavobacterium psychrophilum]|nr:exosortase F system-associated protein [Flavobacterium psychrophilum]